MSLPQLPPDHPLARGLGYDPSKVPASIAELRRLADEIARMGIFCGFEPDHSVGQRGYLIVRVGKNTMHQMNIPAATALLDGVLIGAKEVMRLGMLGGD